MKKLTPALLVSFLLTACGGSSDKTDEVVKPKAPAQAAGTSRTLAESATLGVVQAKVVREATLLFPFANVLVDPSINLEELPKDPKFDEVYPPSNCLNEDGKFETAGTVGGNGGFFIYDNCNVGDDTFLTGMFFMIYASAFTDPEKDVFGHYDLTIKKGDQVDYIDGTRIECPRDTSGNKSIIQDRENCTYISGYKAINGIKYRLDRPIMEGDSSQGYRIYTDVTAEDQSTINIASSGLLFNCDNKLPSSGSIDYNTEEYSANLTFPNCSEYILTESGVSQTYSWGFSQAPK